MRLGIATNLEHRSPEEWAGQMKQLGCGSVLFPVDYTAPQQQIDAYQKAAKDYDLVIAEVGVWCSPLSPNEKAREAALERCVKQLELADYVKANCCVNVSGSAGARWDGAYAENFSEKMWEQVVTSVQTIIDKVSPKHTYYTLEPMPWMIPMDPEQYMQLIQDIGRERFAVHMDAINWITDPQKYFFNKEFMENAFEKMNVRIKSCHIKDVRLKEEFTWQLEECECGAGNMDLERYAELANEISPDMPMIIEHLHSDEEYLKSLSYVKNRLKKYIV